MIVWWWGGGGGRKKNAISWACLHLNLIDQKGIRQNGFPPSSLISFLLKLPYTLSWPSENYTVSNFNVFNFYKFHQESTSSKFKISYGLMGATYKNLFVRKTGNRNAKYGYIHPWLPRFFFYEYHIQFIFRYSMNFLKRLICLNIGLRSQSNTVCFAYHYTSSQIDTD